jgi:glucose/arabinose dehydrogenase
MTSHRVRFLITVLAFHSVACGGGGGSAPIDGAIADGAPIAIDATAPADAQPACQPVSGVQALALDEVARGLAEPVFAAVPPGDRRIFVVERAGRIVILEGGLPREIPFLDLRTEVESGGQEQGLLGLAFHPDYATNRRFFVYYIAHDNAITIAELVATDGNTAAPASRKTLLSIPHPDYDNHNGGWLEIGPDGYLYAGTGDGGAGGDPDGNAQNKDVLLGKMLRVDVSTPGRYAIPPTNPFAGAVAGADEIWAFGLRNPWRNTFDGATGDLYIADVGQNYAEEINVQPRGSAGGQDYGWDILEGTSCYNDDDPWTPLPRCDRAGRTLPVHEYKHEDVEAGSASLTGGVVYRGCRMPELAGTYFFADAVNSFIRSFRWDGTAGVTEVKDHGSFGDQLAGGVYSFGRDADGEVLVLTGNGKILRIVPRR